MPHTTDSFVHLHGHSHYSLMDSTATIQGLCERTKELDMPALAVTDHGNLFGAIEFYNAANKIGIKPIIGCEFYVAPRSRIEKDDHGIAETAYHLVVLAKNETGYKNLLKLASLAYTEGFHHKPPIDKELLAQYHKGLVVINGHLGTELSALLQRNDLAGAVRCAGNYKAIFGDDFYVELQNHHDPVQMAMITQLLEVARKAGCPIVATNDYHYLLKEEYEAHDALCCIGMGCKIMDEPRVKYSREMYLKSPAEMRAIFKDYPEACDNTIKIAEQCNLKLDFSKRHTPIFVLPKANAVQRISPEKYLRQLCVEGVKEKYGQMMPEIQKRLDEELEVIQIKSFTNYFLILWDCCNFARQHDIPVTARGSSVGMLVGYLLSLCNVDPLRYDLLSERFMDPSRRELPDIEVDICQEGRGRVIDYLRRKYVHVCPVIEFNTFSANAAIRACCRVLDMPPVDVAKVTKLIPNQPWRSLAIEKQTPAIRKLIKVQPPVARVLEIAERIEGLCQNTGGNRWSVVLSDKPLDEVVPLYKDGFDVMTQWPDDTCKKVGLLKLDFYGLITLTINQRALYLIEKERGNRIDLDKIDFADQKVYQQIFQCGQNIGLYLFGSGGMKDLLMKMQPDRIEDLIAAYALYRPGPMELVPDYCARKHGKQKVPSLHELADPVLEETYGIMVYQEQVMQVLNCVGNIPLVTGYQLVKTISKRMADGIAAGKKMFIEGAGKKGIKASQAEELFTFIEKISGYTFCKAHAAHMAILAFQTAWLKVYYPSQYMAVSAPV